MSLKGKGKILIVDDERSMREMLEIFLRREGYAVAGSANAAGALAAMAGEDSFDLVVSDINMPGLSGLDLLREVRKSDSGIPVIMITAYGSPDSAVEAMKLGAADYITKPFRIEEIKSRISAVIERRKLAEENVQLHRLLQDQFSFENIVGRSPGMKRMFEVIERVSPMDSTVVITGASGTGKELIARALHHHGAGRKGPFVSVNCGALVETLLESELFGHRKGSFTGADSNRQGLFETASGGTLFLDEITETSSALQVKLLRAIQEREVVPVGGTLPVKVDARIIVATNRDLAGEVKKGNFREDLYYRLNVIHIQVPALRERREDIPLLMEHFFKRLATRQGRTLGSVAPEAMRHLMGYGYPGNVRELENIVERAVALATGDELTPDLLPEEVLRAPAVRSPEAAAMDGEGDLDARVADYERQLILSALRQTGGNRTRAAEFLGITFRSLRYRLKKLGMAEDD
ncbi:MAG: sigma-54 dependent transcriptional regulator [bacterium]|nr:sigma-54 dependent transcriptional regulator [bacterium]MDT8396453.1 sigma-54 dependent transcriptional regulator [bacterium]